MRRIPVKNPLLLKSETAEKRKEELAAPGSIFSASLSSAVVMVILHSMGECSLMLSRMSVSRKIRVL